MEKEFTTYEQALALKELGFDELCLARLDGGGFRMLPVYDPLKNSEIKEDWFCVVPLYSQAFKFFRDNHNLLYYWEKPKLKEDYYWDFLIYNEITGEKIFVVRAKHNKEAESACLDKLIEIVKNDEIKNS